jgi:ArsR family transcriptional regulator
LIAADGRLNRGVHCRPGKPAISTGGSDMPGLGRSGQGVWSIRYHIYMERHILALAMKPEVLFNLLSDPTRLRCLMLIQAESEACVCEMTFALEESQPKISRHLALMRDAGLVTARREGTWMHYRIDPDLPSWANESLRQVFGQLQRLQPFQDDRKRLDEMSNRPGVSACA